MTATKPEKWCYFINLKIACYIFSYFLLALQTRVVEYTVTTVHYYFTRVIDVEINTDSQYLTAVILFILFAGVLVIGVAVAVVAFTIVLLVGLYKESWNLLKMYLIFSTIMLVLSVIVSIVAEVIKEPSESVGNSISIAFNAYFIYVIGSFWLTLHPHPITFSETDSESV